MDGDQISNPYLGQKGADPAGGALVRVEQQRAIAEVQARMIIARSSPRNPMRCMDMILQDCTRPSLAEGALYQYARGGTSISGPSIRLAEAIAQRWGNIASGIKEVSRDEGYSECVAYAWDLETGFYDERQFQVRHWRDTKSGGYRLTDERDIYELIANMGQRRKRAVLLTVIPGDVIEAATRQCEQTLQASADTSPEALKRLLTAFAEFAVTKEGIEARCQCRIEAVRPAQIIQLRKIYASLKDGMSVATDWFSAPLGTATQGPIAGAPPAPTRADFEDKPSGAFNLDEKPQEPVATRQQRQPRQEAAKATPPPAATKPPAEKPTPPAPVQAPANSGFSEWLVDADGTPIEQQGESAKFTDPVAYMQAVTDYLRDCFPADRPGIERANSDAMDAALLADAGAQAIYDAYRNPPAPPAAEPDEQIPPDVGETTGSDAPGPADAAGGELFDRDPLEILAPTREVKAEWEVYAAKAKLALASCTSPSMIDHFTTVNSPAFLKFPPKYRIEVLTLIDTRRKEIAPPPPKDQPATSEVEDIKKSLTLAADACKTKEELVALDGKSATRKAVARLQALDPDECAKMQQAFRDRHASLP